MVATNLVFSSIASVFGRPNPRLKASYSLARILTQLDLRDMPYDEGINSNRRADATRHVSIGIWLIPIEENQTPSTADTSLAQPAVTCDLRRNGIGVLVPARVTVKRLLVAVADLEESWRFFLTDLKHISSRPGGWFQLGLNVVEIGDLEPLQILNFRNRLNGGAGV